MRIGIDLGGTKIEGLLLDNSGVERARVRVSTPPSYAETVHAIVSMVHHLERSGELAGREDAENARTAPTHSASADSRNAPVTSVGIGIPGAVTPATGLVKNANSTWLIGQPLIRDLERELCRAVRARNDADCFALSEATDGAASGAATVFGVILGTGVGGGIVIHHRAIQGPNLITGEWGHNSLPWPTAAELPGPSCYCGRHGCIESWLSGPAFSRDFASRTGRDLPAPDIVAAAAAGDVAAIAARDQYFDRLARALASVINILDPEVIVLGGGMSNIPKLAEAVLARLSPWVFSDDVRTRVVKNHHGDSSGVRGAAWLWPKNPH